MNILITNRDAELKRLLTRSCMRLKNESKTEFEQKKRYGKDIMRTTTIS